MDGLIIYSLSVYRRIADTLLLVLICHRVVVGLLDGGRPLTGGDQCCDGETGAIPFSGIDDQSENDQMKGRIRERINRTITGPRQQIGEQDINVHEEYFDASEIAQRLKLSRDTIKNLMRNEIAGVIRIGNTRSTMRKRTYTTERYSASAVERLIRKLERGEDPRYSN